MSTSAAASGGPGSPAWQSTWTLRRAVLLVVVAGGAALVFGRPAIALLLFPLAVGVAVTWAGQTGRPSPSLRVEMPAMAEAGRPGTATITIGGLDHAELAILKLPDGIGSATSPYVVIAAEPAQQQLSVQVDTSTWGIHEYGAAGLRVASRDGLFATGVVRAYTATVRVLPPARSVPVPELPARAAGQVGAHRTRRPGDGTELLDVREFRPGDRIRRIDWRVSARHNALHVRHTAIDSDADLVICLDTRFDLTADVMSWHVRSGGAAQAGGPAGTGVTGSLGMAVTAAMSLAASYLRQGDRVGLVDLAVPYRGVRPGTGFRQLMRIRWHLAGITPDPQLRRWRFDEGSVPSGAAVVVLSPFIDDQIDPLIGSLVRMRRDVLAIDVLPDPLELPSTRAELVAARLVLAERAERLAAMKRRGALVTPWDPTLVGVLMRRRPRFRRSA